MYMYMYKSIPSTLLSRLPITKKTLWHNDSVRPYKTKYNTPVNPVKQVVSKTC